MLLSLPEEVWFKIFKYLDFPALWMMMILSPIWARYIGNCRKLLLSHQIELTAIKFEVLTSRTDVSLIPFSNVRIKCIKGFDQLRKFYKVMKKLKPNIEILELEGFKKSQIKEIMDFFQDFAKLRILSIKNCSISEEVSTQLLQAMPTLMKIHFEKCDGNFFKFFHRQEGIIEITVRNPDWTWNGFSHDDFNDLVKALPNLDTIILDGSGTGSYFDCDHFPYRIRKLVTSMITFHWYVGIRSARKKFLETQKTHLKELIIHQLPYDFDGGNVLKYIIEQMNLDLFYYGKTCLIKNGQIQPVSEFAANEIQLCAMFEMFRKFRSIRKFQLKLSDTDVDSGEIERLINPRTELFNNVETLEIFDNSGYRRTLGIFLGLFKNFRNIRNLKIKSPDSNINVLLQEFLHLMTNLRELYIDSNAPRVTERLNIIRNNVTSLTKLWVNAEYIDEATHLFGVGFDVNQTDTH